MRVKKNSHIQMKQRWMSGMGRTIGRNRIEKIITILTAAILVLLPVGGSIREVHAEGEESSDSGMSLEHEKTVTENADVTYDL